MINFDKLSLFIHFKQKNTLLTINKGSTNLGRACSYFLMYLGITSFKLVNNPDCNCTCNERNDDRYACTFYKIKARDVCDTSYGNHNSTDWAK